MNNMLLAVGIGNTSIKLGVFEGQKLAVTWQIASATHRMPDEYAATLLGLLRLRSIEPADLGRAAMWCTVPSLASTFEELLEKYFNLKPLVVAAGIRTGIKIRMDNPREVGADRISNAVAAHSLYGGPLIIVDMGTASTFDTVSAEGEYMGGAIAPGIMMAAEALFTRPAQLYRVPLDAPKKAIGSNTVAAMQSGIIYGYTGLVEGMVARLQKEMGGRARVVATGGYAPLIMKETEVISEYNPDLSLIGLSIISGLNRQ
jgi:type III pantothenate kinase